MFVLPPRLVEHASPGALIVEIGVGKRFDALNAIHRQRDDLALRAVDVNQQALQGAPDSVETAIDDVWDPHRPLYENAHLLYAVRCPSELQPPLARLAKHVEAPLALHVVKDEWAHIAPILGDHILLRHKGHAWRVHDPFERVTGEQS